MTSSESSRQPRRSGIFRLIRRRLVSGLFVALPVFITFLIIDWVYRVLLDRIIGPVAGQLKRIWFPNAEGSNWQFWIEYVLTPAAAILLVLSALYIAGMFFNSRLHQVMDWILLNVPGVNVVYSAVKNVVDAIGNSRTDTENFKRTVLVEFPHPGMKVPAFVTSECQDQDTGRRLLSVYVPTTPIPTSGYMLLVPESDVVEIEWNLNETLQAIVSGGITMPEQVRYNRRVES